jgi:hypothetical protein
VAIPNVPPEALSAAMERFDRELRETAVWADWEQNRAHRYAIEHAGRRYPVKQIISTATGIPVSDFSGGQAAGNANRYAISHGLAVVELRRRNPTWMRDELILALDIYLRYAGNPPRKGSAEIDELSETLNRLGRYLGIATEDRFRNVNGVYMKLMNFRRFDPAFTQVRPASVVCPVEGRRRSRCGTNILSIPSVATKWRRPFGRSFLMGWGAKPPPTWRAKKSKRLKRAELSPHCIAVTSAIRRWFRLRSDARWPRWVNLPVKPVGSISKSVMGSAAMGISSAITQSRSTR